MKINKVTFTGADNETSINDMIDVQKKYPFVEWGILISSNQNRNRYPSEEFIKSLEGKDLSLALHLCGKYSRDVLSNGIVNLPFNFFDRYQLNFNFKNTPYDINYYGDVLTANPNKKFILQYNKSNSTTIDEILNKYSNKNTNVLFDASGGRGKEIQIIKTPFDGVYTGYSGGLNPDNVDDICSLIESNTNTSEVWIDMESGVRTNDIFDMKKIVSVLEKVKKYING